MRRRLTIPACSRGIGPRCGRASGLGAPGSAYALISEPLITESHRFLMTRRPCRLLARASVPEDELAGAPNFRFGVRGSWFGRWPERRLARPAGRAAAVAGERGWRRLPEGDGRGDGRGAGRQGAGARGRRENRGISKRVLRTSADLSLSSPQEDTGNAPVRGPAWAPWTLPIRGVVSVPGAAGDRRVSSARHGVSAGQRYCQS